MKKAGKHTLPGDQSIPARTLEQGVRKVTADKRTLFVGSFLRSSRRAHRRFSPQNFAAMTSCFSFITFSNRFLYDQINVATIISMNRSVR
jgi:hypothetical protein